MGAWGFGIFESDHDLDVSDEFDLELGIGELGEKAVAEAKAKAVSEKSSQGENKLTEEGEEKIDRSMYYSIHNPSDPDTVRAHLEKTGALERVIDKYVAAFRAAKSIEARYGPEYKLVLLAACAMQLGCKLPPDFKKLVKKLYPYVGLMDEGCKQKDALDRYEDGDPFDLGSKGLVETMDDLAHNDDVDSGSNGWTGANVPGMGSLFAKSPAPSVHSDDICATCGSKADDGKTLLVCSKCKKTKYCDKDCQKIHWGIHKRRCKAPVA